MGLRRISLLTTVVAILMDPRGGECGSGAQSGILFIGDGMGLAHVTAARIYQANARDGHLAIDDLEHTALVKTYSANMMVTDSGAAGTALATGYKTDNEVISVGPGRDGKPLDSILELAKRAGKSVGLVTTSTITDATPAVFYAHEKSRRSQESIADQLISSEVDFAMGGGRRFFMTEQQTDGESGKPGTRKDGIDLIARAKEKGFRFVQKKSEFDELMNEISMASEPMKALGLFDDDNMAYEAMRSGDKWGEPSLAEMTEMAIRILSRNPKGYFLMVEGGRIDHAGHENRGLCDVTDTLAFDKAIKVGVELTKGKKGGGTLIVVTADHETGGLTINGYAHVEIGGDKLLTTQVPAGSDILTYASGPGADRTANLQREKTDVDYLQPSLIKAPKALHSGVDVIAWATGPGSDAFHGTIDNTDVAKIILREMKLKDFDAGASGDCCVKKSPVSLKDLLGAL